MDDTIERLPGVLFALVPAVNLADVAPRDVSAGEIAFTRRRLGRAAGCRDVGFSHYAVPAGARQMPVHLHGDEEEIFFVLSGTGLSWQREQACEVGPGDVIVHPAGRWPHTFLAGEEGLELLAFASGSETHLTYLPRAGVMWAAPHWVPVDGPHPFQAEVAAGPLPRPEPGLRPDNVVALADVDPDPRRKLRAVGEAGGSVKAGLNHVALAPDTPEHPRTATLWKRSCSTSSRARGPCTWERRAPRCAPATSSPGRRPPESPTISRLDPTDSPT